MSRHAGFCSSSVLFEWILSMWLLPWINDVAHPFMYACHLRHVVFAPDTHTCDLSHMVFLLIRKLNKWVSLSPSKGAARCGKNPRKGSSYRATKILEIVFALFVHTCICFYTWNSPSTLFASPQFSIICVK